MIRRHAQATWDSRGVLSVGGRALCGPPQRALAWSSYVGALPFPKIPIPAFPVTQGVSPAQPSGGAQPATPQPAPSGPSAAELLAFEQQAVSAALAHEAAGQAWVPEANAPTHTEVWYGPYYGKASLAWAAASGIAQNIANLTVVSQGPPGPGVQTTVRGENAQFRADAYKARSDYDKNVATKASARPPPGFAWQPIYQKPDPSAGGFGTSPGGGGVSPAGGAAVPGSGEAPPEAQAGGSGTLLAVGLGLLAVAAAVVYAGSRKKT